MKSKLVLLGGMILLFTDCQNKRMQPLNSPLATVIKLQAAEALVDTVEAAKYQDIKSIYGKLGSDPEQTWKDQLAFFHNLANDKRFTAQWKYYDYDIVEESRNDTASVSFKAKDTVAAVRQIAYTLAWREKRWIVTAISYTKSPTNLP